MLTHPDFAAFTHVYGQLGAKATPKERSYLARLYWFTVEFGLVQEQGQTKIMAGAFCRHRVKRFTLQKAQSQT